MTKRPLRSAEIAASICVEDLRRFAQGWTLDGEYRQLSPLTTEARRNVLDHFFWWLNREGLTTCGSQEIKGFLHYATVGHKDPGGRYGVAKLTKPLRPRTVKDIYGILRSFFRYLVEEQYVDVSPLSAVRAPINRADQIQPFTESQIEALLRETKKTRNAKRDEALVLFMLDTGIRASELCGLRFNDVDIVSRKAIVLGKGNKHRSVYFGRETGRILWQYVREEGIEGTEPLFLSTKRNAFTRSGLLQLIERLGDSAGVEATRCSPHTLRHTFAVMFLRGGGSVFTLKEMLGHTDLAMTSRYVALAQADVQNQHRQFSPVERLRGRK